VLLNIKKDDDYRATARPLIASTGQVEEESRKCLRGGIRESNSSRVDHERILDLSVSLETSCIHYLIIM
jgi:hypothetical protein